MFFWNSLAFLMIQRMLAILYAFYKSSSQFMYCWSLTWKILDIILQACEMSAILWQFEHSLSLPFSGIVMKTDLFQSCGHCWVFQICWHIECSAFTVSSFRSWNSSVEIPSPPLALFIVIQRPTWLCTPGCLVLGEWSHHHGYLGHEDLFLFFIVLCILATS